MSRFLLRPRSGINEIRLGDRPEAVRRAVGQEPEHWPARQQFGIDFPARDLFFDGALVVHYDEHRRAEWIAAGDGLPLRHEGLDLFQAAADTVLVHLMQFGTLEEDDQEPGRAYVFPSLQLSLWRPDDPRVLQEELAASGNEKERRALRQALARATFFQQIAVFSQGYWAPPLDHRQPSA